MSIDAALKEAKRLKRERQAHDLPPVILLYNDPEAPRLLGRSLGEREAMIGSELFAAAEGESVKQFHRRLAGVARERRSGVTIISVGDDEPQLVCRFNLDGSPITVN